MKTYTPEQITDILTKHTAWLKNEPDSTRADLRGADLSSADLRAADAAMAAYIHRASLAHDKTNRSA